MGCNSSSQQLDIGEMEAKAALQSFYQSGRSVTCHDDGAQPSYRARNGQKGSSERRPSVRVALDRDDSFKARRPKQIDTSFAVKYNTVASERRLRGGKLDPLFYLEEEPMSWERSPDERIALDRGESFKARRPKKIDTSFAVYYNTVASERRLWGGKLNPLFYLEEEPMMCIG